jgi:predicted nucleotidyltransferase
MISFNLLVQRREDILRLAARRGVSNIRVFGSVARGEATPGSDVDLLVDVEPGRSLLDLGGLLMDLQALLDCQVDIVTEKGLRARIRERVLREAVPL